MEQLLTVAQAANVLQVSIRTFERLIASRRIQPVKVGSCNRIEPAQLEQYIERHRRGRRAA